MTPLTKFFAELPLSVSVILTILVYAACLLALVLTLGYNGHSIQYLDV